MRAKRTLTIAFSLLVGALALAIAAAVFPPVQTWAVRRVLASAAGPGASLKSASVGWGRISLEGLRIGADGATLVVPSADMRVGVISACLGGRINITGLVAKGWTLDLARPPRAAPAADASGLPAGSAPWVRQAAGAAYAAFNAPARLSLAGVDLEGTVVLPDGDGRPVGRALVVVAGGGLAPGRAGRFEFNLAASLDGADAPVSSLRLRGALEASMDGSGMFTRADLGMAASASGRQFPNGIGLSGEASASRSGRDVAYSFTLERGAEEVASLDARSAGNPTRIAGSWRLNLRDTDLAPFALGRALPAFDASGQGRFEVDASSGDVHAVGKFNASADRLGVIAPGLAALGGIVFAADFDMARTGGSLRVDRLEARLSGAAPVASVLALQPFEFNAASGELKVARPSGDLVGISVNGIPLSWLKGLLPGIDASGGDFRGEFAMRAENGRLALRTREPLAAAGVSLSRGGRPIFTGLDISAFVLADYAPNGWQVQLAPLSVRSDGVGMLSLDARLGRLAGAGEPVKAEGSWGVSLPALMAQPAASGFIGLGRGEASGSFTASLGASCGLRVKVALDDLVPAAAGAAALPSARSDASVDFDPAGRATFVIPLHLSYPARTADVVLSGTLSSDDRGAVVDAELSGGRVSVDDLSVVAALCGSRPLAEGPAAPSGAPARAFWPARRGRVSVRIDSLAFPRFSLGDVRGSLSVEPGSIELEGGSARFGDDCRARVSGKVVFVPAVQKPYSLRATVAVSGLESGPLLRAINPEAPPPVEGRFDLTGELTSGGAGVRDLVDGLQGQCRLSSGSGSFRALRTGAIEPLRQNQSKIADALDSVTSLFGKKTDKYFDAVVDSANALSEIHYDQMSVLVSRGADLDLHFTEVSLIAPEEHITGSGTVAHVDGVPIDDAPLSVDLVLGVRGRLETLMGIVGMLKEGGQDDLGYSPLYQPIHLGGTLRAVDQSQWRDMLVRAPLRRAGGLFDKLLGR
jgi:hypothetical protein